MGMGMGMEMRARLLACLLLMLSGPRLRGGCARLLGRGPRRAVQMSPTPTIGFDASSFLAARICSHASTAHMPSFSRTWFEPVPKLSSPQMNGV